LAAVQGIVRGHKGALTISSEPGKGSTFRVYIPIARPQESIADALPVVSEFRGEGTILVVDDEELVRHTVQAALERYGYLVLTAANGPDAIRMLAEAPDRISLVLLDMTMPIMSGADALKGLMAVRADLPVIATSGYDEMEALRRFGGRVSGFIQKPYAPRKLAEKIRETLQKRATGSQA
jgi:CheY-like chemotaxis protein